MMIWKRSEDLYDGVKEIVWMHGYGEQAVARVKVERGVTQAVLDAEFGITEPAIFKNDTLKVFVEGKLVLIDVDMDGLATGEREQRLADIDGLLTAEGSCLCIPAEVMTQITEAQDELFQAVDLVAMGNETYSTLRAAEVY